MTLPRAPISTLACIVVFGAAGCAYTPPSPGQHRGPGEPRAETECSYDTPTATRFMSLRCQRPEDAAARGERDREAAREIRVPGTTTPP